MVFNVSGRMTQINIQNIIGECYLCNFDQERTFKSHFKWIKVIKVTHFASRQYSREAAHDFLLGCVQGQRPKQTSGWRETIFLWSLTLNFEQLLVVKHITGSWINILSCRRADSGVSRGWLCRVAGLTVPVSPGRQCCGFGKKLCRHVWCGVKKL